MDLLQDYVLSKLREDEAIVQEIDSSIKTTIDLFSRIDFEKESAKSGALPSLWAYWILDNDRKNSRHLTKSEPRPEGRLSQSTTSMIIASIGAASNPPSDRSSSGYRWDNLTVAQISRTSDLNARLEIAVSKLAEQWQSPARETQSELGPGTSSSTFGHNDILTISWHLDIFSPESPFGEFAKDMREKVYENAQRFIQERIVALSNATSGYIGAQRSFNDDNISNRVVIDAAYNLLRFVRCIPRVTKKMEKEKSESLILAKDRAFYRFQSRLHDQLSFDTITDSRFDSSELAFCLEGMLQLRPDSVNHSLLKRVMEVLEKAQASAPYWPSDMPIIADHKGQVLYPASVEIARSLLASISIFDMHNARTSLHASAGSRYLHLIKRYWQWLKTRRTTITTSKGERITGWHSENLNDTAVIHTWETSQILEFCVAFRDQMLRYISRNLLELSRLDVRWPKIDAAAWTSVIEQYEAAPSLGEKFQVYAEVGKNFIAHHERSGEKKSLWSILLYGPPGTGKSEFAHNVAGYLGVPLITITASDFLAEGEGRMENRAKLVFDVLTRQTASVVLFDEMDQFMLDRDSDRFSKQESAFQFLTPGMLTKLGDLRKRANVIFIIATNYEERIDAAIKRAGRIDKQYLMLPPDGASRIRIMRSFDPIKKHTEGLGQEQIDKLIRASVFLGYTDLKRIANEPWKDFDDFYSRLDRAPRSIQFYSYKKRFEQLGKELNLFVGPQEELECLFRLAHEAWGGTTPWEETASQYECGKTFKRALIEQLLNDATKESRVSFIKKLTENGIRLSI